MTISKKIAILSSSYPPLGDGGITSAHFNLAGALRSAGHEVRAFTFFDKPALHPAGEVVRTGLPYPFRQFVTRSANLFLRLKGEQGHLYQFAYNLTGALGGLMLVPGIRAFRPEIILVPDRGAPSAFWPSMPWSRIIFLSHHNPLRFIGNPLIGSLSEKDARYAVKIESLGLKRAHAVVCPSHYMKEVFKKTYSFANTIKVIPNVADTGFILSVPAASNLRKDLALKPDSPIVYIPGAGSRIKGSDFVYEVIRRIASAHGKEIGFYLSGHIDDTLRYLLTRLPENVRMHAPGHVPYADLIATMKVCSLCVSPTLFENFGMALLEAAFCGIPTISFDVGGNRDIIKTGLTGFLVPFLDIDALIEKSLQILGDNSLHSSMSDEAKKMFSREFSPESIAGTYDELFEDLSCLQGPHPE